MFDRPMRAVDLKEASGIGLFRCSAGDAVGDFVGAFLGRLPFDHEGLSDVREVEVVVECGGGPDLSGLDPPMLGRGVLDEVRFVSILEEAGDILEQGWLVAFDGEVVVRLSVLDQVAGELALSQERIGADILTLDGDGIQQRSSGLDLVGPLGLITALYRQGADFFWV